jgi:predicted nucleic acid-binding protein
MPLKISDETLRASAEAIRIALELGANLVLMDERKGTAAARALGLHTIGVFGVLLEAKRAGIVADLLPQVDELVSGLHFFVSPELRTRLAELAGE